MRTFTVTTNLVARIAYTVEAETKEDAERRFVEDEDAGAIEHTPIDWSETIESVVGET